MYLDLCNPTARHHLEKDMDKLEQLQAVCKVYDYGLDYMPPDGEGGGGEDEAAAVHGLAAQAEVVGAVALAVLVGLRRA